MTIIFLIIMIVVSGLCHDKRTGARDHQPGGAAWGLLLAAFYYPSVADCFAEFTKTEAIANLIGFLIIFLGCLTFRRHCRLFGESIYQNGFAAVDRSSARAVFGFIRGWAIASIIVLALIAFPVRENLMARSYLAPYLLAGARAAVLDASKLEG